MTTKEIIIRLRSKGKSIKETRAELSTKYNFQISAKSISKFLKRYKERNSLENAHKSGRPTESVTSEIKEFIDKSYKDNDELSSPKLQKMLQEKFGVSFSRSKVKRLRRAIGWTITRNRYCQLIREANHAKRLEWCLKCLETGETFDNVVFTDESSIEMESHGPLTFRKEGQQGRLRPAKPKHPFKVHVWAGISKRGQSGITIFGGIMEAEFYCDQILKKALKPFLDQRFPDGHRFQQDNDPKHTSKKARAAMDELGINWWKTPPESPDLNPIENVWHQLKGYLRTEVKPMVKDELINGIQKFWTEKLTLTQCVTYINHLHMVIPLVIANNGGPSGR